MITEIHGKLFFKNYQVKCSCCGWQGRVDIDDCCPCRAYGSSPDDVNFVFSCPECDERITILGKDLIDEAGDPS